MPVGVPVALRESDQGNRLFGWVWFVVGSLMAVGCLFSVVTAPSGILIAVPVGLVFAYGAVRGYHRLFRGGLALELDLDGIAIPRRIPVVAPRRLLWRDVDRFDVDEKNTEWVRYYLAPQATPPNHRGWHDFHADYGGMTTGLLCLYLNDWVARFNPHARRDPHAAPASGDSEIV
jgi:hypothetical protein